MLATIHHTFCPACRSASFKNILRAKDYTISGEWFDIIECLDCSLRFTQDVPAVEERKRYYKSENYISHSNTSRGLINRLYHKVRKRTMVSKRKLIEKSCGYGYGRLLDVGSGTGYFAGMMRDQGWDVTGLEPDAEARALAYKEYGIELLDGEKINSLPSKSYDAITLWHVLEHVDDVASYLQLLSSLIRDDGRIFIAVPNYTSYDAKAYKAYWAAYDVPRHLYHFSPRSLSLLVLRNGLKIEKYKSMWYDSFYISLLSSKYKCMEIPDGKEKVNWFSALWIALLSNLHALFNVKKCSSVIYILRK